MRKVAAGVVVLLLLIVVAVWWRGRDRERTTAAVPAAGSSRGTGVGSNNGAAAPLANGRVEGRVRDGAGAPIAGATVHLDGRDRDARTAVTRADGTFELADVDAGRYDVVASAAGFVPARVDGNEVATGQTTRVDLTLTAGGVRVRGVVSDASGGPIEGAVVTADERRGLMAGARTVAAATTAADGSYALTVAPGKYTVGASRDDYLRDDAEIEAVASDVAVDLRLVPAGIIEGIVKDVATGEPVAGAVVHASAARTRFRGERVRSRPTAADGRFRVVGVAPGSQELTARVSTDGRTSREPTHVAVAIGEQVAGVELWVEAAPYLAGKVVDEAGVGIAQARVLVMSERDLEGVDTDDDGSFRVLGIDPGKYHVAASHPRFASSGPQAVKIESKPITDLRITLRASPRVVGRVDPAIATTIEIDPAGADRGLSLGAFAGESIHASGPDGRFEISPITPGRRVLAAKAADGRRGQVTVVVPDTGDVEVTIKLEERASIAGTVRDQKGAPLAGVTVAVRKAIGGSRNVVIVNGVEISGDRVTTAADGSYLVRGLDAGAYDLAVQDQRGGPLKWARGGGVSVKLGVGEQKRGVDLAVSVDDEVIRGVVVDGSGRPKADAWVTVDLDLSSLIPERGSDKPDGAVAMTTQVVVTDDDGGGGGGASPVLTDDQGRFEIRNLRRGTYEVLAEADRGALRGRVRGVATGTSTTVPLTGLAAIAGVVTANGAPVTDFTISVEGPVGNQRRFRAPDGRFRFDRLEPGDYQVLATAAGGRGTAEATVVAGGTAEVALTLALDGTARGRLVDPQGQALAGSMVIAIAASPSGEIKFTSDNALKTTGPDGAFSLSQPPGEYELLVLGQRPVRTGKTFTLVGGQEVDLGDVTVTPPPPPGGQP